MSALARTQAVPVPPGLPESRLRSEWQMVLDACTALLSVLCVESLSSFLIVNCQSVGLLCAGALASVFSVESLSSLLTAVCEFL